MEEVKRALIYTWKYRIDLLALFDLSKRPMAYWTLQMHETGFTPAIVSMLTPYPMQKPRLQDYGITEAEIDAAKESEVRSKVPAPRA